MPDWIDDLDPHDRRAWDQFVAHARRDAAEKIAESDFVTTLLPTGEPDIKFSVELGLAIMYDKPIIVLAQPGQEVPRRLREIADAVIRADLDTEEGRAKATREIERHLRRQ